MLEEIVRPGDVSVLAVDDLKAEAIRGHLLLPAESTAGDVLRNRHKIGHAPAAGRHSDDCRREERRYLSAETA